MPHRSTPSSNFPCSIKHLYCRVKNWYCSHSHMWYLPKKLVDSLYNTYIQEIIFQFLWEVPHVFYDLGWMYMIKLMLSTFKKSAINRMLTEYLITGKLYWRWVAKFLTIEQKCIIRMFQSTVRIIFGYTRSSLRQMYKLDWNGKTCPEESMTPNLVKKDDVQNQWI